MKLCLLSADGWQHQDSSPYFRDWDIETSWIAKSTAAEQVGALTQKNYDLFVNLCDGLPEDEHAGIEVIEILERLNVPFTGATSEFYGLSRESMKRAIRALGLKTPGYFFSKDMREIEQLASLLSFPLIVKHPTGHCSDGLTLDSRVESMDQLCKQVERNISEFGSALVEEFIEGREYTVLVVENADDPREPFLYNPAEFVFPPDVTFKYFNLKWIEFDAMKCVPCDDSSLAARLKEESKRLFVGLNGSGYARCDFRVDGRGVPYVLEINAGCGIFYPPAELGSADFILTQHANGHSEFIERIVRAGLARYRIRSVGYSELSGESDRGVNLSKGRGLG